MLNELLLLSGVDIPFPAAQINIHQPTLKDIAFIGEESFFIGCELLKFSKDSLISEDRVNLQNQTNFVGGVQERHASGITFDASRSNPIYGNSATVQPNAVKYRAMVQLANGATDEALETCTGVLADVANLKDLSNITATGKETSVGWGMPDYTAGVALSDITPSNSYTAPSNGYLFGTVYNGTLYVNGKIASYGDGISYAFPAAVVLAKTDVVTMSGNKFGRANFYPCKGVN